MIGGFSMSKEEKKTSAAAGAKFNTKKLKYGSVATVITVIVIAVVVVINVIVAALGERTNLKLDLTSKNAFEISQETIDYITSLNQDVEIVTMSDENVFKTTTSVYYKQAYEVLKKYEMTSDRIKVEFVDMTKNPTYANKYQAIYKGDITSGSIVVSCVDKSTGAINSIKVLSVSDLFNTEFSYQTFTQQIISSKAEQVLTSAIMYVTDPEPKSAVILQADSAGISDDALQKLLENDGFNVSMVNPLTEPIPMEADMIVINAPTNDFSEGIIDQLYTYMENGGNYGKNMIYLASVSQKSTANIDAFLAEWGIKVENSIVGDTNQNNLTSTTTYYAIKNYIAENDYSANVAQPSLPVVSYNARPVTLMYEYSGNVSTKALLSTEATAFALTEELQEQALNGVEPDINSTMGVYNTMALSNKYTFDSDNNQVLSNLLVIGSSDMVGEYLTSSTHYNNGDYFISIINKMTGKSTGITIVAKDLSAATFDTDQGKYNASFWVFMVLVPLAVLVTGIVVWLRRRHK